MNPSAPDPADARPAVPTKIFFASRTHSQLSQVFAELRKTTFAQAPSANDTGGGASAEPRQPAVRALALGSRRNLCVNPSVLAGGPTGLDERCLDLLSTSSGCSFLPSHAEGGMETSVRGRTFGDKVLSRVRDVEDLRRLGEDEGCCSYYGSRALIDQAEVRLLPLLPPALPSAFETRALTPQHPLRCDADHRPAVQPRPARVGPIGPVHQPRQQRPHHRRGPQPDRHAARHPQRVDDVCGPARGEGPARDVCGEVQGEAEE